VEKTQQLQLTSPESALSMTNTTFTITGMTCGNCVRHVQEVLAPLGAVTVGLTSPQAVFTSAVEPALVQAALSGTRYLATAAVTPTYSPTQQAKPIQTADSPTWFATYRPLLLLLGYILLASIGVQAAHGAVTVNETMRYFMAGFFLAFSFFKFLDLPAFANAYAGYDLLASKWWGWGMVYPFVELGLGLAYLTHWQPALTHWITIIVMGFSAIGVIRAVVNKQAIRCACLGSVFNLPMSTVTIVEDVGMVLMAAWMLTG
jgi:copper chaperone CopZ